MQQHEILIAALACIAATIGPSIALAVDYDIVYVRAPRNGPNELTAIPEVFDPIQLEAGSDLVLLRPNGSEDILVD